MWVRAVWIEKDKEIEDVVPDLWVKGEHVFWPPFANAEKAMKTRQTPMQSWRMLVKLKYKSESRKDCEEYDNTTTIENTDDEEESELKRKPKKKRYADFVTAETSEVTTDKPNSKDLPVKESTKSKEIPLPVPPAKLPVQDSRKKRVDSPRLQLSLPVGNEDRHRSRSPLSKKGSTGTSQYEDRQRSDASYKSKTNRSEDGCRSSLESQKDIRDSWSDLSRDSPSNHMLFQRSKDSHRSPSGTQRDGHNSGVSRGSQPGGSRDIYRSGSERDSRKSGSEGSRDSRSKEYRYSQEPHLGSQRDRSRSRSGSTESRSRSRHSRDFIRSPSVSHSDRSGSEDRNSLRSRSQQSRDSNRPGSHRSFDYRRSGSLMSDEGQRCGSNLYDDRLGSELLRSSDKDRYGSYRQGALQPRDSHLLSSTPSHSSRLATVANEKREAFPMSEAKFQKKVLHLLAQMRNDISDLKAGIDKMKLEMMMTLLPSLKHLMTSRFWKTQ